MKKSANNRVKKLESEFIDITLERGLKDRAQRTLLDIDLALERGELELIEPVEKELTQLVMACKSEYLAAPEKIKAMLYTTYGIDMNITYLDDAINDALIVFSEIKVNAH